MIHARTDRQTAVDRALQLPFHDVLGWSRIFWYQTRPYPPPGSPSFLDFKIPVKPWLLLLDFRHHCRPSD